MPPDLDLASAANDAAATTFARFGNSTKKQLLWRIPQCQVAPDAAAQAQS
jgi:hypothetical protein